MNIAAVIPARGGSKGIPRKNLTLLGEHPLLAWSIRLAQSVEYISSVYVSTEDEEIAQVGRQYGAQIPFMRPAVLANDTAKTVDAVADLLERLKQVQRCPDIVVLLQPTQPFRTAESVQRAIELFQSKQDGVVSVCPVDEHPILMRHVNSETHQALRLLSNIDSTVRRQDFSQLYRVNGAVYVNSVNDYFERRSLNDNPYAIITDRIEGTDIDSLEDLEYARWLYSRGIIQTPFR